MKMVKTRLCEGDLVRSQSVAMAARWVALGVLLLGELLALTLLFDFSMGSTARRGHLGALLAQPELIPSIGIPFVVATLLLGWPRLRQAWAPEGPGLVLEGGPFWGWMLLGHFVALGAFAGLTSRLSQGSELASPLLADAMVLAWFGAGGLTAVLWALAGLSLPSWSSLLVELRWPLVAGLGVGLGAVVAGQLALPLWRPLGRLTLQTSAGLLGLIHPDLVYRPSKLILGTPRFEVYIAPACSGFEGMGLMAIVLGVYLWYRRNDHRFPQALALVPLGLVLVWLANALRIAALVEIGHFVSPQLARTGFHSQMGWIAFNAIGLGLVLVARRIPWFSSADRLEAAGTTASDTSAAHLVPLMILIASMMLTGAVTSGFDRLYPLRFLATAAVLIWYRRDYLEMSWTPSWWAVVAGVVVFVVWMALEPRGSSVVAAGRELAANVTGLGRLGAALWIAGRIAGSVVTVPIAEELAFRGYLTRRLIAGDFECVPPGRFAWPAFLLSSVLFGLLHGRWVAGTLAGLLYALVYYRRGRIGEAVAAHALTNALIAAFVLTTGAWSLWM